MKNNQRINQYRNKELDLERKLIKKASDVVGDDILKRCRKTEYVIARICVGYLTYKYTILTYQEIANELNIHHATLIYYIDKVNRGENFARFQRFYIDTFNLLKKEIEITNN